MSRYLKKILPFVLALLMLVLCACSRTVDVPAPTEAAEGDGIFTSDITAIDFLEGTWTNNRAQYITAERGDSMLIVWGTNIPLPQYDIYVLKNGFLVGGGADGEEQQLLRFEYIDADSLTVHDLVNGEESLFVRDSLEVDADNLDNDYVFWTMNRASVYLSGMWMNEAGNYFTLAMDDYGSVSFNSDLPCPDCDYIDFFEGDLCGFTNLPDGTVYVAPVFTFDIISADEVSVLCAVDGNESVFTRLSHELDDELLNSEYVFANNQRAFAFLDGRWSDDEGHYFRVQNVNGGISWNTNLPLNDSCESYGFMNGGLYGTSLDENGEATDVEIYAFRVISEDELEITVSEDGDSFTLTREE